jgi:cystathionine gamma-synthase
LTLRGLRTLHIRLERQCKNAFQLAEFLSRHSLVKAVHYPGLANHPQHDVALSQMKDDLFGGMLSFEVSNETMAMAVAGAVCTIKRATSLGGTETLIEHRASIEPDDGRVSPPGLLRMSVGLEDCNDLIQDLETALKIAGQIVK